MRDVIIDVNVCICQTYSKELLLTYLFTIPISIPSHSATETLSTLQQICIWKW